jgi:hypothetical protein
VQVSHIEISRNEQRRKADVRAAGERMSYYKTTVKDVAELVKEIRKFMRPLPVKTFAVAIDDMPSWTSTEGWTEISKIELLIEINKGMPVFKFNFAAGKWEPL